MNTAERSIVIPLTIAGALEWYEVYLYVYWAKVFSSALLDLSLPLYDLIHATALLMVGVFSRPLGGLLFGYIGDKIGRRQAFYFSVILLAIPSFLTVFLSSFSSWNFLAIFWFTFMKFLQGIPAGGELPGALCFLAEGATYHRRRYLCSYLLVGPQIGQMLSLVQIMIFETLLPIDQLLEWGWRISFAIGGVIGLSGIFIRKKLHESEVFHHLQKKHEVLKNPISEAFGKHKKDMLLGFLISIFEVVGFYIIAFYIVQNESQILGLSRLMVLLLYIVVLSVVCVLMPIIGKLGDLLGARKLLYGSAIGIILVSIPFYIAVQYSSVFYSLLLFIVTTLILTVQFSLLPAVLADLFPTSVRFTCVGFSFNLCDSLVGGIIPMLGVFIFHVLDNTASFIVLLPVTAVVFIVAYSFINKGVIEY
ncbi:MAG: Fosfomycin resistance protein AbaF [Chlamydiia bacterium]|nr:Fosfomycin resistance protein AbaF [Chlamydiia bacterium]MCH9615858.1 Fosfomycin resistance protein AbaF [Chlamydiia bacterium]MCH9628739.1 Fosfomycin resistance protein AbaF [Chlamydiia bacterium]